MKGDLFPSEHTSSRDSATGAVVHQMTSHPSINHATYFLQSSFTPDGRTLLVVSYRTGSSQLFAITPFPAGPLRQLTDGVPIHPFSPAIHPDGERVFFVRKGGIWILRLSTLEETCVIDDPAAQLGECSLAPDGEWLTAAAKKGTQSGIMTGKADGTEWRFIPFRAP